MGTYSVTLGGLAASSGNVQVTAVYGGLGTAASAGSRGAARPGAAVAPAGFDPVVCKVTVWSTLGSNELVGVQCRDHAGNLIDNQFNLTFTNGEGLKGSLDNEKVAYLWADLESAASYKPHASYRYSSAGISPKITRQGTGTYTVVLKGMPKGGSVQVTGFGATATRCVAWSIRTSATPQKIGVRCYNFSGAAVDAKFTLSYER